MKIDPSDEATLPPLGECVVLEFDGGWRAMGGRVIGNFGAMWVLAFLAPDWSAAHRSWRLIDDDPEQTCDPVSWHPIGGEA